MQTKPIYLKITIEMIEALNEKASALGVPRASIIKTMLSEGLQK